MRRHDVRSHEYRPSGFFRPTMARQWQDCAKQRSFANGVSWVGPRPLRTVAFWRTIDLDPGKRPIPTEGHPSLSLRRPGRGAFVRAQALAGRLRSEAHEIRVLRRRFQARGDRRTNTKNCSHSITTVIEMPKTGGEGVIVAEGSKSAGFACTCRTANSYTVTIGSSGN